MSTLGLTIGALEVGTFFSSVLYGVATLQVFMYSEGKFKDPLWLRLLVGGVWILETAHTVFIWIYLYSLTVTNYGDFEKINEGAWSLSMALFLTTVLGSTVQSFFGYRVWALSGSYFIPAITWVGSIIRLAFGSTATAKLLHSKTISDFLAADQWIVTAALVISTVIDITNTSALCFYLQSRRTGFTSTRKVVDKLMMYTIETGLLSSMFALAILTCSLVMPHNLVYFGIFLIYPKLFSNSFFTSLNSRQALRRIGSDTEYVLGSTGIGQQASHQEDGSRTLELSSVRRSSYQHGSLPGISFTKPIDEDIPKVESFS